MKNALTSVLVAATLFGHVLAQEKPVTAPSALIVFDASGSMWGQIKGRPKIEIAREVVANLVESLPAETELGLMAYGHRRKGDCADIELLIPVGKVDRNRFVKTVNDIIPKGMTPITASLELAAEALGYREQKATVILVSDGLETCNADPCVISKKLEKLGVDFTAHVIAFDLKPEESEKLRCIAESTGGKFFPASDAASLKDALDQAVDATALAADPPPAPAVDRAAKLTAADTAVAGVDVEVSWDIEAMAGDYVTIAEDGAHDSQNEGYTYTKGKKSAPLTTLLKPGKAELRYISGTNGKVIARRPIALTEFEITLTAPAEVIAGSEVPVAWTGPNYPGDFITIVSGEAKDGIYEHWGYTKMGTPLDVTAPLQPGNGEIRYMNERGNVVLKRAPIKILKGEITMSAAPEALAGAAVSIKWTGPNNKGDFITIVPNDTPDGGYAKWDYTKNGSPLDVNAPHADGPAEIRYMNEDGNKVLQRIAINIVKPKITLKAAARGITGEKVSIQWTGPNHNGDYITIVPKSADDGVYESYAYTKAGSPVDVIATTTAGESEIRYMNEDGNIVLARAPIVIVDPE